MAKMLRIFSGIQPSGMPHLGNYLGAIRNWVDLQKSCDDVMYSIVDLHALTVPQAPFILNKNIKEMAICLLACGIDPCRSTLFQQSKVGEHCELMWLLSCKTPNGWLNRMTQWKTKGATDNRDVVNIGLFAYPVLMAADILLYRSSHVPVGDDQLQHLELTRDIARSFNSLYGTEIFPEPQPILTQGGTQRIMSLRNPLQKMSKSDNQDFTRINLDDGPDAIRNKIRKAVTDSTPEVTYDPSTRPGVSNLVTIYSAITGLGLDDVVREFERKQTIDLKDSLSEIIIDHLTPLQEKMNALYNNGDYIEDVLSQGAKTAKEKALETLRDIRNTIGID
jgi:tryptophanyl-tRNA synthetase